MNHPTPHSSAASASAADRGRFSDHTRVVVALSTLLLTAFGTGAQAQISMIGDNTSGQSWETNSDWKDNQPAHDGADYVVGANFLLRTPTTANPVFPGSSLTLAGQLNLGQSGVTSGTTYTFDNLTLANGGVIANATSSANNTHTLLGNLLVDSGTAFVRSTDTNDDARNITVGSLVSGGSDAVLHFLRHGTFTVNNAANTFAGTWQVGGTNVAIAGAGSIVSNSSTVISTLSAVNDGSLGSNASVALGLWSRFDIDFDWSTTGSLTLLDNDEGGAGSTNAIVMTLDQHLTVGSLTVAGSALDAGKTYDYTALSDAGFGDYFTNDGGSITVIPEPSTGAFILGGLAAAGVVFMRRRRRG